MLFDIKLFSDLNMKQSIRILRLLNENNLKVELSEKTFVEINILFKKFK